MISQYIIKVSWVLYVCYISKYDEYIQICCCIIMNKIEWW